MAGRQAPIRVLIADDQVPFAAMLETILADEDEVEVVARASDGNQAVALAAELEPDIVVMDITMPRMDGLEATRLLRQREPAPRVIVLTESDLRSDVVRAERAGADGYVPKTQIATRLRAAIFEIASR
jgi:DNA-binding NarL/FixJ family response regulator